MHFIGMLSTRFVLAEGSVLFLEPVLDRSYLANPKYISGYARKGDGRELLFALARCAENTG